jgi:cytochrome b
MIARVQTIWDVPTRLLHWGLAVCVTLNLFVLEDEPHRWSGYVAVALVLSRFLWGLRHSRSLRGFVRARHNALAATVYLLIWLAVIAMGVTGWMMGLDAYWGEEWLEELHANIAFVIKGLILIHLAGMTVDSLHRRQHAWRAMFTGIRE